MCCAVVSWLSNKSCPTKRRPVICTLLHWAASKVCHGRKWCLLINSKSECCTNKWSDAQNQWTVLQKNTGMTRGPQHLVAIINTSNSRTPRLPQAAGCLTVFCDALPNCETSLKRFEQLLAQMKKLSEKKLRKNYFTTNWQYLKLINFTYSNYILEKLKCNTKLNIYIFSCHCILKVPIRLTFLD